MKTLKDFIDESKITHDEKNCVFRTNCGELCYYDMPITTSFKGDALEIQTLSVSNKRKGVGTELVKACIEYAKKINKDIVLYASPLGDFISEDDLIKFYKNLGFEQIDNKNKSLLIYRV